MRTLDEVDEKIIDALRKDGRASYRDLASQVGISNVAVRDRINKLHKEGYNKGFFRPDRLEDRRHDGIGPLLHSNRPAEISSVANELAKCEEVTRIYEEAGASELIVHALFAELQDMQNFIEDTLYKTKGISKVSSSLILKRYKYDPSMTV